MSYLPARGSLTPDALLIDNNGRPSGSGVVGPAAPDWPKSSDSQQHTHQHHLYIYPRFEQLTSAMINNDFAACISSCCYAISHLLEYTK